MDRSILHSSGFTVVGRANRLSHLLWVSALALGASLLGTVGALVALGFYIGLIR